jgi:hypothetical protein
MERPTRVIQPERAIARYGQLAERLLAALGETDPLADELIKTLNDPTIPFSQRDLDHWLKHGSLSTDELPTAAQRFFAQLESIPSWVDWKRVNKGGDVLFRSGILGGMVLGAKSLIYGYCAPGGNKPLVMSGRFRKMGKRRLGETSRFVEAVSQPGGMGRWGEGFAITVRVRLMHAQVRHLIWKSNTWEPDKWGAPINQHDMVATVLLFSSIVMEGLRQFGIQIAPQESDNMMQLWRYIGYLMGVKEELLPTSEKEANTIKQCIYETQAPPDDDARQLTRSLIDIPLIHSHNPQEEEAARKRIRVIEGICRGLIGDELADGLGLSRTPWRWAVPIAKQCIAPFDNIRRLLPPLHQLAITRGRAYWTFVIERDLQGKPTTFSRPTTLFSTPS